jgi:hypothetical protein
MRNLLLLLACACLTTIAFAADGVVGKDGSTLPVIDNPQVNGSRVPADVEYNTTGTIDGAATLGGSATGWGTYFLAQWTNGTGAAVVLVEFGWPCGGPGPVDWVVWTGAALPGAPGTQTFGGLFTPASADDITFPPPIYSYIDVTAANIVVPAGSTIYFGYENPGLGGQISANGVTTWAWYEGGWDPDSGWSRTAVLQLKANYAGVPAQPSTLSQIKALFD